MKHLIALALLVTSSAAYADTEPKTLTLQNGSSFQLQGWTRLNGTAAFQTAPKPQTPIAVERSRNADRERRLRLEAEYQRQKAKKDKAGAWGEGY